MAIIKIDNPWAFGAGIIGNILSFMVYLSPVLTFYRIYKKKSTESFHSIPYVVTLFCGMLWVYNALLMQDMLLLIMNSACCFAESIYLAIYLIYAPKKPRGFTLKLIMFLEVGLFGSFMLLTLYLLRGRRRVDVVGWVCAFCAVSEFAAPLSIIRLVIRTKSVEYMPFSLIFFLTVSGAVWFIYGLLLKDFFVAIPNGVGFALGVAQMIFYLVYMNAKSCKPEAKDTKIIEDATPSTTLNLHTILVEKKSTPQSSTRENEDSMSEA